MRIETTILTGMFSVRMNDLAAASVGAFSGPMAIDPPGGLSVGLREFVARGIVLRGEVVVWAGSRADIDAAPGAFGDLTGWECAQSSFHLEDHVAVERAIVDGLPCLGEDDQRLLLQNGVALARALGPLVHALTPRTPLRCIIAANNTNGTFRFHRIRSGEHWNAPDLDTYRQDKVIVVDIEPIGGVRAE